MSGAPQRRKARRVSGSESNRACPSPVSSRDSHTVSSAISNDGMTSIGRNGDHLASNFDRRASVARSQYSGNQFNNTFQRLPQTQSSPHVSVSSPETDKSASRGPALSQLLHPSHEPVPNTEPHAADSDQMVGQWRGIEAVCADLEISSDVYPSL